jgi:hypothetical protein
MLYRSTDCRCRSGAAVENLAHSASFQSRENTAPSNPGIKHLGIASLPPHVCINEVVMSPTANRLYH